MMNQEQKKIAANATWWNQLYDPKDGRPIREIPCIPECKECGQYTGHRLDCSEVCYEHFGQRCQIVEANVYDTVENAEVVIEAGFGERTEVEFSRLSWDFGCRHNDSLSKMSLMDFIRNGSEAANDLP